MDQDSLTSILMQDIIHRLHLFFNHKIKILVVNKSDLLSHYNSQFDKFAIFLNRRGNQIYFHLNTNSGKKLTYTLSTDDFTFEYIINKSKSSSFYVTYKQNFNLEIDSAFLTKRTVDTYGYVYVLESDYGYKIGCSAKLRNRLSYFGTLLPFKYSVHSTVRCKDYGKIELLLHDLLKHKRINGEWFSLEETDFKEIDMILNNFNLKRYLFDEEKMKQTGHQIFEI